MELRGEIIDTVFFEEDGEELLEVSIEDEDGVEHVFVMDEDELDEIVCNSLYFSYSAEWIGCPVVFNPETEDIWIEDDD